MIGAWIQRQMVRRLVERHPLPWRVEHDWTTEIHDAQDDIVLQVPHQHVAEAEQLIRFAEQLVVEDQAASREVKKLLNKPLHTRKR